MWEQTWLYQRRNMSLVSENIIWSAVIEDNTQDTEHPKLFCLVTLEQTQVPRYWSLIQCQPLGLILIDLALQKYVLQTTFLLKVLWFDLTMFKSKYNLESSFNLNQSTMNASLFGLTDSSVLQNYGLKAAAFYLSWCLLSPLCLSAPVCGWINTISLLARTQDVRDRIMLAQTVSDRKCSASCEERWPWGAATSYVTLGYHTSLWLKESNPSFL